MNPPWLRAFAERQAQHDATLKDAFRPMSAFTEWQAERQAQLREVASPLRAFAKQLQAERAALFKGLVPQWLPRSNEGGAPSV